MTKKITDPIPKHRILREVLRHITEYRDFVMNHGGTSVIEHGYWTYNEDGTKKEKHIVRLSFWDLDDEWRKLSERKRQAVYWNVIRDKKQKDVAELMGITTVSVGQYVEQAMIQLAERYFADDKEN